MIYWTGIGTGFGGEEERMIYWTGIGTGFGGEEERMMRRTDSTTHPGYPNNP
jgi:hypothetical protein